MGNNHNKLKAGTQKSSNLNTSTHYPLIDAELSQLFKELTNNGEYLTLDSLSKCLDLEIASALFRDRDIKINTDQFINTLKPIFVSSAPDTLIDLFFTSEDGGCINSENIRRFLLLCCKGAGVKYEHSDETFLLAVEKAFLSDQDSISLKQFKQAVADLCPRICDDLNHTIIMSLRNRSSRSPQISNMKSGLLSDFEFWWLIYHVPTFYVRTNEGTQSPSVAMDSSCSKVHWHILYDSAEDGLSVNRFENKVLSYRSPTVILVRMEDDAVFAIGSDEEFRQSPQAFGGLNCFLVQILPKFALIRSGPGLLYFNTKQRSLLNGIVVGSEKKIPDLLIEPDFSNIHSMEVWGCGSAETLAAQGQQKVWEKRQAEKHAKVPLPGTWDDNPDKAILEMAGRTLSHAQR